ncbi:restriction endonuclease [Leptospira sp. 201903075]|uniref:restriction endonuclease n=1 Tax=Leptospira chreensis TaxID=2810035 RepID=UPI00196471C9|nr:restriction endonuclease [Leptospira chreensis]MBM9589390.1 restriction endonuclease [Leptospira chreensis]
MEKSKYDELHDKYYNILSNKSGTRYEILAAVVFKSIDEAKIIIHDLKLISDESDVPHQIDVLIENKGKKERILIECKDLDSNVDLPIARNFFAVMDDLKVKKGIILTTKGFSENAKKYAKSKGISLALLQTPNKEDFQNRTNTVELNFIITSIEQLALTIATREGEEESKLLKKLEQSRININYLSKKDKIYINLPEKKQQLVDYAYERAQKEADFNNPGKKRIVENLENIPLTITTDEPIYIPGIIIDYNVSVETININHYMEAIPELILKFINTTDDEFIIFDTELRRFHLDPKTKEIKEK